MGAIQWVFVAVLAALALYGAGAIGWALGRRAERRGPKRIRPAPRAIPARARADQLVDLGELPKLLDRRDVLIISTVTTGVGLRAEVVDTAVLDTTGAVRLNRLSLPVGGTPTDAGDMHGLTSDRLREVEAQPWKAVYAELVELLAAATLVVGYNGGLHRRMVAQTAERYGLKRLPATDWGCLMRRYTEATAGADAQWIELADAVAREGIAAPETHWAVDDARTALELLGILARRQEAEREQSV